MPHFLPLLPCKFVISFPPILENFLHPWGYFLQPDWTILDSAEISWGIQAIKRKTQFLWFSIFLISNNLATNSTKLIILMKNAQYDSYRNQALALVCTLQVLLYFSFNFQGQGDRKINVNHIDSHTHTRLMLNSQGRQVKMKYTKWHSVRNWNNSIMRCMDCWKRSDQRNSQRYP